LKSSEEGFTGEGYLDYQKKAGDYAE